MGYAEAAAELDAIIAELDQGQVDLDVLADRFQRATDLIEELNRRIKVTRAKVDELAPRLDAILHDDAAPAPPTADATELQFDENPF
jgi:exodeoxyribonuclease VII small subunit